MASDELEFWLQVPGPCQGSDVFVLVVGVDELIMPGSDFMGMVAPDPTNSHGYLPRAYFPGGQFVLRNRDTGIDRPVSEYLGARHHVDHRVFGRCLPMDGYASARR